MVKLTKMTERSFEH